MSLTFDERFHVALRKASAPSKRDAAARRAAARRATEELEEELEFGDLGRDPRFLPGWFVIPGFAVAAIGVALLLTLA